MRSTIREERVAILIDINIEKQESLEDLCKRQDVTISGKLDSYIKEGLAMSDNDFEILRAAYNPNYRSSPEACLVSKLSHRGLFNLANGERESIKSLSRMIVHVMLDKELMATKSGVKVTSKSSL